MTSRTKSAQDNILAMSTSHQVLEYLVVQEPVQLLSECQLLRVEYGESQAICAQQLLRYTFVKQSVIQPCFL